MLDSDDPTADAKLHVDFRVYKGEEPGLTGKTFIRIMVPGDKTNIIDRPMRESDKRRFPRHYQSFLMESDDSIPVGILLETWRAECPGEITEGQLEELRILRFRTVDQLATASDAQIQRIGMGYAGLREKAKTYLIRKTQNLGHAETVKNASELADTKAQLAALQAQVTALLANPPAQAATAPKRRGPKPGFKRKALDVHHDAATGAAGHE